MPQQIVDSPHQKANSVCAVSAFYGRIHSLGSSFNEGIISQTTSCYGYVKKLFSSVHFRMSIPANSASSARRRRRSVMRYIVPESVHVARGKKPLRQTRRCRWLATCSRGTVARLTTLTSLTFSALTLTSLTVSMAMILTTLILTFTLTVWVSLLRHLTILTILTHVCIFAVFGLRSS